jgi:hypothetical protein
LLVECHENLMADLAERNLSRVALDGHEVTLDFRRFIGDLHGEKVARELVILDSSTIYMSAAILIRDRNYEVAAAISRIGETTFREGHWHYLVGPPGVKRRGRPRWMSGRPPVQERLPDRGR